MVSGGFNKLLKTIFFIYLKKYINFSGGWVVIYFRWRKLLYKNFEILEGKLMRRCRRKSGYIHKNIRRIVLIALIVIIGSMILRPDGNFFKLSGNFLTGRNRADTSLGWNLILVNGDYAIPDDYELELTELSNGKKVDSRIYPALQEMFDDARLGGLHLFVREGYRTWEEQQAIMDERIEEYKKEGNSKQEAKKLAEEYVAEPGTSEHQLGIAVDINADTSGSSSDAVYAWLDENAYKYGFIKRYPPDKTEITGVNNEPWHYRYVGEEAAKEMKDKNLCLEEYIGQLKL